MPAQPTIRGFLCKLFLEATRNLPADKQRQVFALVPEPVLALIESSPKLGWIPFEDAMKLADALHRVIGSQAYRVFFSTLAEKMMAYPLLQSFFDGAVRLFGLTPQALLKWSTYAWEQVFRESGRLVYQPLRESVDDGKIEMVLESFPPALLRTSTFADSLAGTFDMYLRRVSKKGRVEIRTVDRDKGRVLYEISWE